MHAAEQTLRAFVRRSDDRRLERTAGSRPGQRLLFAAMARRFVPSAAEGFTGDIVYALSDADGRVVHWTVSVDAARAVARRGHAPDPALVLELSRADLVRLAAGELDAGGALLDGRIDLQGDFALATRLGAMFGREGL
jgi:putative sterol carrier protein